MKPFVTVGQSAGEMYATFAAAGILSFDNALIGGYSTRLTLGMEVEHAVKVPGFMLAVQMTKNEAISELKPYR